MRAPSGTRSRRGTARRARRRSPSTRSRRRSRSSAACGRASAASASRARTTGSRAPTAGRRPAHAMGIWLGAYGPRMLRLVGRAADGWVPSLPRLPSRRARADGAIDEAAERAGRDPARIVRLATSTAPSRTARSPAGCTDPWSTGWRSSAGSSGPRVQRRGALVRPRGRAGQTERFAREVVPRVRAGSTGLSRPRGPGGAATPPAVRAPDERSAPGSGAERSSQAICATRSATVQTSSAAARRPRRRRRRGGRAARPGGARAPRRPRRRAVRPRGGERAVRTGAGKSSLKREVLAEVRPRCRMDAVGVDDRRHIPPRAVDRGVDAPLARRRGSPAGAGRRGRRERCRRRHRLVGTGGRRDPHPVADPRADVALGRGDEPAGEHRLRGPDDLGGGASSRGVSHGAPPPPRRATPSRAAAAHPPR